MSTSLSTLGISKDDILGYECRHATYTTSSDKKHDCITIKEYIHLKDGRRFPNIRTVIDFKRPFWVTSKAAMNHKDHLEWDKIENLVKYESTQLELLDSVARATKQFVGKSTTLRTLAQQPGLYGTDITPTVLIKHAYTKKFPELISSSATVAALDIEVDVVDGHGEILCASITFGDRAFQAINVNWLSAKHLSEVYTAFDKYLGKYKKERNITLEVLFVENEAELARTVLEKAHEWKPDFISIWNMNYDLNKIQDVFKKYNYDSARIFSDPSVPDIFTKWKFREGKTQKVTQSGKTMGLHPADRWHIAECPASFYFLDAMCLYKRIRIAEGQVSSYGLDATMKRHLGIGKLQFAEVDKLDGTAWHKEMQTNFKVMYCIYNLFDNIGQELLDEKIGDISKSFSALVGVSDFDKFNSNPRRIVDDLHFFCLDRGLVISATPDNCIDELEKYVIGLNDHIVTLPAFLMADIGYKLVKDADNITLAFDNCADIDIEATYPTLEDVCNISKETTYRELGCIYGLTDEERRAVGVNLTGGVSNAVEICTNVFKLPSYLEVERIYLENRPR